MKRVFLYARVSTEEQAIHGLSIEAQTAALQAWAKEHHHETVDIYVDAGISARKPASKRPELQRLLQDVKSGKGDLIVFTKLDRWFRNVSEYYKVQEILEQNHVDWKTIHEDYDTTTAAGRLKINIMLAVAQDEADRTSERIKAVMEVKRQKLEPLSGSIPIGYKIDGKKVIKDPDHEDAMNAFFADYMAGGSISNTCRMIRREYGIQMSYMRASKILDNKAYCGFMFGSENMAPPYITEEQHETILRSRKRVARQTQGRVYLFSGLIICGECGRRMGGGFGSHNANPYYHCQGHYCLQHICSNAVNYNEKKLANLILGSIEEKLAEYKMNALQSFALKKGKSYKSEIAATRKKIERLKQLFLDDLITMQEYKSDRDVLMSQLADLEEKERPLKPPDFSSIDAILTQGWRDAYESIGREEKKRFLRILIKEVRIYPDRRVEFDFNI